MRAEIAQFVRKAAVKVIELFQCDAPAIRARRYFWTKLIVIYSLIAVLIAVAVVFESWFRSHQFAGIVIAIVAAVSVIAIAAAWHFNVPCPHCGWNINLTKDFRSPISVPSSCPNCGQNLEAE